MSETAPIDLAIIGGGVNGCGIARDAAGRGLSVFLCEQGDVGGATSSASTKLFHGGLRYLEYYEFRLVREALIEREVLLRAMPHISWPMRFVLPHHNGLRPAWLLRLGLFIYDNLGGRKILPATKTLDLTSAEVGAPLKDTYRKGFEYSDCWVQDTRLVVLNARDAARHGAEIALRTKCVSAERDGAHWVLTVQDLVTGQERVVRAKALVNAGGPWVEQIISNVVRLNTKDRIRLVRGSHIVVRRLFEHDRAYIFQQSDNRVVFAIPYEGNYTLIGTTDAEHDGDPSAVHCTDEEADYLIGAANEYFREQITRDDVAWTYSGVRPLYDDGASSATAATRDYVLTVEGQDGQAPLLNVFGGKITTYRKLAEAAFEKLTPWFPDAGKPWTRDGALPGGDCAVDEVAARIDALVSTYPFLDKDWALRLFRHYGTETAEMLGDAKTPEDLGQHFGAGLTEAEVRWLMDREWARSAEDVMWRRTRLGLRLSPDERETLRAWIEAATAEQAA